MRVIITDTVFFWNRENPALEKLKDVLLVVCLDGKAATDKYRCFVSPYKHGKMGIDKFGVESQRYKALESVADDLNREFRYHDDILFLTDGNPESLYPFYVIKSRNEYNRIHLCTISPFRFESKRRIQTHKELLSDLSQLTSILYIDSNKYINKANEKTTMKEIMQMIADDYIALLPVVINSIHELYEKSYFDFASNSYIAIEGGYNGIDLSKKDEVITEIKTPLFRSNSTLGRIIPPDYPSYNEWTKKEIEQLSARVDGKKICNYLREQRIKLAEANGIAFFSEECSFIGPCAGTCEKCDQESAYLREKLAEIASEKRIIPSYPLTEWEVEV